LTTRHPMSTPFPYTTLFRSNVVLQAGATYVIQVGGWSSSQTEPVAYRLHITLGGASENPTPLTVGPAPILRVGLSDLVPGPPPPDRKSTRLNSSHLGISYAV